MALVCKDCRNTKDFRTNATVDCIAKTNNKGEFEYWISENFENPNWSNEYYCGECQSDNVVNVEENNG